MTASASAIDTAPAPKQTPSGPAAAASRAVVPLPSALPRPRVLHVVRPVRSLQVFVTAQAGIDQVHWVAGLDAQPLVRGGVPRTGSVDDMWATVVADIAGHVAASSDLAGGVEFHTPQVSLSLAASRLGFETHPMSRAHARFGDLRDAVTAALAVETGSASPSPRRVLVAVDGSWGKGTHCGGWAFLDDSGRHRAVAAEGVGDCTLAELNAIALALGSYPAGCSLTIRTDSRRALALVEGRRRPRTAHHTAMVRIRTLLLSRDVTFEWTRGHVGAGLHDGADRLAVQARRNREARLSPAQTAAATQQIVAESVQAHRARPGQPGRRSGTDLHRDRHAHALPEDPISQRALAGLPSGARSVATPTATAV